MEAELPDNPDTKSEDVESEASFGVKRKISCQFPNGDLWAVDFDEEEESDVEEMSEDEADLRRELRWKTWQQTVANLSHSHKYTAAAAAGSHNSAYIATDSHTGAYFGGSHNTGNGKSDFHAEAMDTAVQRAKTEAAQVLTEARKIEEAFAAAGESADPDLVEMSAQVDILGDLGVELHELWNLRLGEKSLIKAVGTGKALVEANNASTSVL